MRTRRERDRSGRFLIEGYRELHRALEAEAAISEVYFAPDLFLGTNEPALLEESDAAGAHLFEMASEPFRKIAYRDRPEGLLAVASQFSTGLDRMPEVANPLYLVVEAIEKPGNLGTMLRTADAAGATGVLVCDPTTDLFNPNVVRASLGALFSMPIAVVTTPEAIEWLDQRAIASHAATPDAARDYFDADYTGPVALVVGSEQLGLSEAWLRDPTHRVRIPMSGKMDSLNAAMAAGVLLFEAARQRHTGHQVTI